MNEVKQNSEGRQVSGLYRNKLADAGIITRAERMLQLHLPIMYHGQVLLPHLS